jgi:hypothetical protein
MASPTDLDGAENAAGPGGTPLPAPPRESHGAAERPSKATFLLAFSLRAANMVERFFFEQSTFTLSDGGDESEWAGHR